MKFTAFITITIAKTVRTKLTQLEPTISPPIGSERICSLPTQAMMPAARNCAPSFTVQSRSQRSSATPTRTMMSVASRIARIGCGSTQKIAKKSFCDDTSTAATTPRNIAIPPRRGVGVLWTSRSRMPG